MEMQVRRHAVTGVADEAEAVAAPDDVTCPDSDAARLHMRIENEAATADVENNEVSVGLVNWQVRRKRPGDLLGKVIARGDDCTIRDRQNRFAEDAVASRILEVA